MARRAAALTLAMAAMVLGCGRVSHVVPEGAVIAGQPSDGTAEGGVLNGDASGGASGESTILGGNAAIGPANDIGGIPSFGGATTAGAAGEAGTPSSSPEPLIGSGERLCFTGEDCLGLECVSKGAEPQAMCGSACDSDEACPDHQGCFSAAGLEPVCLTKCVGILDCPFAFDCFDPEKDGHFWCVPAAWTPHWDRK